MAAMPKKKKGKGVVGAQHEAKTKSLARQVSAFSRDFTIGLATAWSTQAAGLEAVRKNENAVVTDELKISRACQERIANLHMMLDEHTHNLWEQHLSGPVLKALEDLMMRACKMRTSNITSIPSSRRSARTHRLRAGCRSYPRSWGCQKRKTRRMSLALS